MCYAGVWICLYKSAGSSLVVIRNVDKYPRIFFSTDVSDGVINKGSGCGGQMQLKILEECELAALENLLRHTHGCEYYNYERCDL